jgi:hypothetical protein
MRQEPEIEQLNVFDQRVADRENRPLHALDITTIQVNIGLTCNLKCVHCHVSSVAYPEGADDLGDHGIGLERCSKSPGAARRYHRRGA